MSVGEVDVVASAWEHPTAGAAARLVSARTVDGYLVARFALASPWNLAPGAIGARAQSLLGPAPAAPAVLVQQP